MFHQELNQASLLAICRLTISVRYAGQGKMSFLFMTETFVSSQDKFLTLF